MRIPNNGRLCSPLIGSPRTISRASMACRRHPWERRGSAGCRRHGGSGPVAGRARGVLGVHTWGSLDDPGRAVRVEKSRSFALRGRTVRHRLDHESRKSGKICAGVGLLAKTVDLCSPEFAGEQMECPARMRLRLQLFPSKLHQTRSEYRGELWCYISIKGPTYACQLSNLLWPEPSDAGY